MSVSTRASWKIKAEIERKLRSRLGGRAQELSPSAKTPKTDSDAGALQADESASPTPPQGGAPSALTLSNDGLFTMAVILGAALGSFTFLAITAWEQIQNWRISQ